MATRSVSGHGPRAVRASGDRGTAHDRRASGRR